MKLNSKSSFMASQIVSVNDGMSEVDLAIQKSINMLRTTSFDSLVKSYNEPNMRRLYMFAFEVCLTNEAMEMTKHFIEFQKQFIDRFSISVTHMEQLIRKRDYETIS
jgi:hypothetical protein